MYSYFKLVYVAKLYPTISYYQVNAGLTASGYNQNSDKQLATILVSSQSFLIMFPLLIMSLSSFNHISQHTSLAFLYVAPILSSTQLPYLIQNIILCSTISNISICACLYAIVRRVSHNSASFIQELV